MSDKLIQSQQRLGKSLYGLNEIGGLVFLIGTRGLKRDLMIASDTNDADT